MSLREIHSLHKPTSVIRYAEPTMRILSGLTVRSNEVNEGCLTERVSSIYFDGKMNAKAHEVSAAIFQRSGRLVQEERSAGGEGKGEYVVCLGQSVNRRLFSSEIKCTYTVGDRKNGGYILAIEAQRIRNNMAIIGIRTSSGRCEAVGGA